MEDWELPSRDQEAIAPSNQQLLLLPASLAEAVQPQFLLQDQMEEEEEEDHLKEAKAHPRLPEDHPSLNQEE